MQGEGDGGERAGGAQTLASVSVGMCKHKYKDKKRLSGASSFIFHLFFLRQYLELLFSRLC